MLESFGYTSSLIDIRGISNILHLKSGLAYLGGKRLLVVEAFRDFEELSGYDLIVVNQTEEYAANCLPLNGKVLVAAGFDETKTQLEHLGYQTIASTCRNFRKWTEALAASP